MPLGHRDEKWKVNPEGQTWELFLPHSLHLIISYKTLILQLKYPFSRKSHPDPQEIRSGSTFKHFRSFLGLLLFIVIYVYNFNGHKNKFENWKLMPTKTWSKRHYGEKELLRERSACSSSTGLPKALHPLSPLYPSSLPLSPSPPLSPLLSSCHSPFSFSSSFFFLLFFFLSLLPPSLGLSFPPNRKANGTPLQYSCLENPMDGGAW